MVAAKVAALFVLLKIQKKPPEPGVLGEVFGHRGFIEQLLVDLLKSPPFKGPGALSKELKSDDIIS
jgi:hypothetical protein